MLLVVWVHCLVVWVCCLIVLVCGFVVLACAYLTDVMLIVLEGWLRKVVNDPPMIERILFKTKFI